MSIDVQVLDLQPRSIRLELSGTTAAQVNAIRRTLLADVPKLAIEDVEFHLGPIRDETTGKDSTPRRACSTRRWPFGSGSSRSQRTWVSSDARPSARAVGAGCPHCQVMYLHRQEGALHGLCEGRGPSRGQHARHSRARGAVRSTRRTAGHPGLCDRGRGLGPRAREWQVAHAVGISPHPEFKMMKKHGCSDACLKRVCEACPRSTSSSYRTARSPVTDESKCILCYACEKACEHGSWKVEPDESRRFLRFETDGSLTPREAFRFALKDLKRRFEELREAVQALP